MSFPSPKDWRLVVARMNEAGEPVFVIGAKPEATMDLPGGLDAAFYWRVDNGHSKESPGAVPQTIQLAERNGSTVGVVRYAANSGGVDVGSTGLEVAAGQGDDPSMHASDTIDYQIVLSGKIDLELPGGKTHTVVPGDIVVLGGVLHAWKNHYDEDCTFLAVTIGYNA